jgi:tryptophan-rich sensory protein
MKKTKRFSSKRQVLGLVEWLALSFMFAALGGAGSIEAGSFYAALLHPGWAPQHHMFSLIWTFSYILISFSAWVIWRIDGFAPARNVLLLFIAQLAVNSLWSWLFFEWHMGGAAFLNSVVLACLVVATIVAFWRVKPLAGALLLPYLLWVVFVGALTYELWQHNPQVL